MTPEQIQRQIEAALPGAAVNVQSDDNVHFTARVIAAQFTGKRTLQRHQMVYRALGAAVGGAIHALSLDTRTPEEWAARAPG